MSQPDPMHDLRAAQALLDRALRNLTNASAPAPQPEKPKTTPTIGGNREDSDGDR